MATSSEPLPAPSSMAAGSSSAKLGARAGSGTEMQQKTNAARVVRRLPPRADIQPETGIATGAPTATSPSASPSSASPSPRRSLTAGMRPAHEPEEHPVEQEDDGDRAARGPGAGGHALRLEAGGAATSVRFAPASILRAAGK